MVNGETVQKAVEDIAIILEFDCSYCSTKKQIDFRYNEYKELADIYNKAAERLSDDGYDEDGNGNILCPMCQ